MSAANELTRSIINFIRLHGGQAERISPEGRVIQKKRVVPDYLMGGTRIAVTTKRIRSSMQRGTADISATINGRSVKIEVKIGRDKQSEHQKRYQQQIERAGGQYWLVKSLDQFMELYNGLV